MAKKYEFEMPTEWMTLEDLAYQQIKQGVPEFNPELVSSWEQKLEPTYAPVRQGLKQNMANYWASLFPQGGGTGTQAANNMGQMQGLELNKLNMAQGFAQNDLATKLALYQNAQNQLSGIGNTMAQRNMGLESFGMQSELAKYLAQIQQPQQQDFFSQLLGGLSGGIGQMGGMVGMGKLLSMIPGLIPIPSSKDFKEDIKDNKIDTLDLIKNLDIKTFRYKGDPTTKKHIGIIAEDTPDLLTTDDKKYLDTVNLFGTLLDAVKQIILRLDKLEAKYV